MSNIPKMGHLTTPDICDRPTASNSIQQHPTAMVEPHILSWMPFLVPKNHPMTLAMGMMSPLVPPVSSWLEHPPWRVQWFYGYRKSWFTHEKWRFSRVMLVYQRVEISMFGVDLQTSHVWFSKGNRRQSFRTRFVGHDFLSIFRQFFAAPYTGWCIVISISMFPSVCLSVRECILPIYLYFIDLYWDLYCIHIYIYIYIWFCSVFLPPPMVPLPFYLQAIC